MGRLRTWQHVRTQLLLRSRGREQLTFERRSTPATTTHAPRRLARACVLGSGGSLTERRGSGIPLVVKAESRPHSSHSRVALAGRTGDRSRFCLPISSRSATSGRTSPSQHAAECAGRSHRRPDDWRVGLWDALSQQRARCPLGELTNAFVHYPLCCPSRATILSGLYAHHHGVKSNSGGKRFNGSSTLATWLDQTGYETAL